MCILANFPKFSQSYAHFISKNVLTWLCFFSILIRLYICIPMADINDIRKRKEALTHKTFVMAVQVIFVFGIPAFGGLFLGNWLNANTSLAPNGRVITLSIAFVLSWTIIIFMYRKLAKQFKALDKEEAEALTDKKQ